MRQVKGGADSNPGVYGSTGQRMDLNRCYNLHQTEITCIHTCVKYTMVFIPLCSFFMLYELGSVRRLSRKGNKGGLQSHQESRQIDAGKVFDFPMAAKRQDYLAGWLANRLK